MEDLVEDRTKSREQILRDEHTKEVAALRERWVVRPRYGRLKKYLCRESDIQRQSEILSDELRRAQQVERVHSPAAPIFC